MGELSEIEVFMSTDFSQVGLKWFPSEPTSPELKI